MCAKCIHFPGADGYARVYVERDKEEPSTFANRFFFLRPSKTRKHVCIYIYAKECSSRCCAHESSVSTCIQVFRRVDMYSVITHSVCLTDASTRENSVRILTYALHGIVGIHLLLSATCLLLDRMVSVSLYIRM